MPITTKHCEFEPSSWRGVLDTTLCDKVCLWLPKDRWFSPDTPVSSTNKTERHDIAEILTYGITYVCKRFSSLRHIWPYLSSGILFSLFWFLDIHLNYLALRMPDEGHSRNASCTLNLTYSFFLDNFSNNLVKAIWFWACLIKVIPETCRAH